VGEKSAVHLFERLGASYTFVAMARTNAKCVKCFGAFDDTLLSRSAGPRKRPTGFCTLKAAKGGRLIQIASKTSCLCLFSDAIRAGTSLKSKDCDGAGAKRREHREVEG
jgi:hypothetical protein